MPPAGRESRGSDSCRSATTRDRDTAIKRALELFGWFGGGWKVNSELPGTAAFEAASSYVRPEDIADAIPCGDSVEAWCRRSSEFADAGFTHVALCQIGGDHQAGFIDWFEQSLSPALSEGNARQNGAEKVRLDGPISKEP